MNRARNLLFKIAVFFLILVGVAAFAAPFISPFSPTDQNTDIRFSAPDPDTSWGPTTSVVMS